MSSCPCCVGICCGEEAETINATISNATGTDCDQIGLTGDATGTLDIDTVDDWTGTATSGGSSLTFGLRLYCDPETNRYVLEVTVQAGDCDGASLHTFTDPEVADCDPWEVQFLDRAITFTGNPNCCGNDTTVDLDFVFTL
jgi:hypothetical protein